MKRSSTSLVITEKQIKTTVRYHFTPTRLAKIKNTDNNKCWVAYGEIGTVTLCWWDSKLVQPLWKNSLQFLKMLNIRVTIWPSKFYSSVYIQKNLKPSIHRKFYTWMFRASSIIMPESGNKPNNHQVMTVLNKI